MNIAGDWDGFNAGDTTMPFLMNKVSPPGTPAGADWFTNVVFVAASGGDVTNGTYQFKLAANGSFTYNWGGASVTIDGTTSLGSNSGSNAQVTLTNGFYYSFRTLNPPTNGAAVLAVVKTSARPVSVVRTGQSPAVPRTNDTVTISIGLSAAKSPEENIFVRWTTNGFATSSFAQASGSGTSYTATIPPMTTNGTKVIYYILSSTVTPAGGLTGSNADALTLNLDGNGGSNYTYTTYAMPWPGFGYPSDPASNIHHWKEEAVIGNGYINVMLDQNGALYDIYYPSVGNRHGVGCANEGYRGPEQYPNCPSLDQEADGQMNMIAGMGGIAIGANGTNNMYWLKNTKGTDYQSVTQQWDSDSVNVVVTSNSFVAASNSIQVIQYDFCPATNALPIVTDGTRTNYGVYIKRFLLTNNQVATNTVDFYYDANFNINGGNVNNTMYWERTVGGTNYNAMVAYNNTHVDVSLSNGGCLPNGYTTQYCPPFAFDWIKNSSIYFATAMKLVTNTVTGAGAPADGSWRDLTATDNQEGWLGKRITLAPGVTNEVDVMIVGCWDDFAGATETYNFWGHPMITWFYTNNMATAQAATETYWSNWLGAGVTANFPSAAYNTLFKRALLVTALHLDAVTGSIIAGMHNGAYPFVWPRDGIYVSITLDRTGHTNEAAAFYRWLGNTAFRGADCVDGGLGLFAQKYTTDGTQVWNNAQVDETASVPWGLYYHYLATGDGSFLTNNWNLAFTSANASSETGCSNSADEFFDAANNLMSTWNVWEETKGEHLYSNASIVRGLRDAANIATLIGSNSWATTFQNRASLIVTGIVARMNSRVEPADISHLGIAVPFEVLPPSDPHMTNVIEWISGRLAAGTCAACTNAGGPWYDNLVENDAVRYPAIVGLVNRYGHKDTGATDNYWNTAPNTYLHSPWSLACSWYGEYYARWQDYFGGTSLVDTNKNMLDLLINKLGPMGLAAEQIAPTTALQLYPGFWLQTGWPSVWEANSTLIDQMMMFLDYKPEGTNGYNTCYLAPKLPSAWSTMTFNNLDSQGQRFDVTITESPTNVRADLNKHTVGALNYDLYLRIPAGITPVMVVTNGAYYIPSPSDYDTNTGRVHVQGPLTMAAIDNYIVVTYGNNSYTGDGIPDSWALQYGLNPLDPTLANQDPSGHGFSNLQEYQAAFNPTNSAAYVHIITIAQTGNDINVTYLGANGDNTWSPGFASRTNVLEFAVGASNGSYLDNFLSTGQTNILSGGTGLGVVTNLMDSGGATNTPSRYYRVRVLAP